MSPRPIALVFEYDTLNGGERSMLAVLDRLAESPEGDAPPFVALAPASGRLAKALQERGVRHIPFSIRRRTGARVPPGEACERLLDAIGRCDPMLVHANSLSMGRLTGAVADCLPMPTVAHLRDIVKLSRRAVSDLGKNRLLLAVSAATKSFHVTQGLPQKRVRVLYNGVDCARFRPRRKSGNLKTELGLPDDAFLWTTIGQIGLRKGQDVLAEAAMLVEAEIPSAHFVIVGERNSTKAESIQFERAFLDQFVRAGMSGRLHCLGYREDVDRILNEIDVLVHPAHQEPLGRVLLEAAAAGVSIIATDVGGTREILEDGVSARLVPPGDPAALAAAMREIHVDEICRERLAAAACARVRQRFNIEQAALNLAAVWKGLT